MSHNEIKRNIITKTKMSMGKKDKNVTQEERASRGFSCSIRRVKYFKPRIDTYFPSVLELWIDMPNIVVFYCYLEEVTMPDILVVST